MIWSVLHRFHHFWYGYKDRWELPEAVTTDNGPQFTSFEFSEFLRSQGIEHRFTSLYNPQSNGGVERFNRTTKERIKAFMAERKSFAKAVRKTLYNKTCSHRNISSEVDDCNFEDINVNFFWIQQLSLVCRLCCLPGFHLSSIHFCGLPPSWPASSPVFAAVASQTDELLFPDYMLRLPGSL